MIIHMLEGDYILIYKIFFFFLDSVSVIVSNRSFLMASYLEWHQKNLKQPLWE